jgi:hypothetical protein
MHLHIILKGFDILYVNAYNYSRTIDGICGGGRVILTSGVKAE